MKRTSICLCLAAFALISMFHTVLAASVEEDAKALSQKVAQFIKENGKEKGASEVMKPNGQFSKPTVTIAIMEFSGLLLANQGFPNWVGLNQLKMRDADGKYFNMEAIEMAKKNGSGWNEFSFTIPGTKKIGRVKGWVQRVEGMDLFVMGTPN